MTFLLMFTIALTTFKIMLVLFIYFILIASCVKANYICNIYSSTSAHILNIVSFHWALKSTRASCADKWQQTELACLFFTGECRTSGACLRLHLVLLSAPQPHHTMHYRPLTILNHLYHELCFQSLILASQLQPSVYGEAKVLIYTLHF